MEPEGRGERAEETATLIERGRGGGDSKREEAGLRNVFCKCIKNAAMYMCGWCLQVEVEVEVEWRRSEEKREFTFGLIKNINVKKVLKLDNVPGVCRCTIITGIQSSVLQTPLLTLPGSAALVRPAAAARGLAVRWAMRVGWSAAAEQSTCELRRPKRGNERTAPLLKNLQQATGA